VSRAKHRPPKLEPTAPAAPPPAPPPTLVELLERAKVAGPPLGGGPGPTELRRFVERLVAGDRRALGALAPIAGVTVLDAWAAVTAVYGASPEAPRIDPERTIVGIDEAGERIRTAARAGARIAVATARPASMLGLHLAAASMARDLGAELVDLADVGPLRADGRARRYVRWTGGVAAVTDGEALLATRDAEAAREWMFVIPRPALVVADGSFAEAAWEAGVEVVAFAGLDRAGLAIAAARGVRCTLVPLRTDRPPRNYRPLEHRLRGDVAPSPTEM
jgi:hypothetical protein